MSKIFGSLFRATSAKGTPMPHMQDSSFAYGSDWAWRPAMWQRPLKTNRIDAQNGTALCDRIALYHDAPDTYVALSQQAATDPAAPAPFVAQLEIPEFAGSYLSMALDLPTEATLELCKSHLLSLEIKITSDTPTGMFARLNIKNGPNVEQVVREMPIHSDHAIAEFDMAYTAFNEHRLEKAWIDLIFRQPEQNQIILHDLTAKRTRRADL